MNLNISVVNKHHTSEGEYIGRGSPLGNPYPIDKANPRDVVIAKYEIWLEERIRAHDQKVLTELDRLARIAMAGKPLKLKCFCYPRNCHGDVIKRVITEAIGAAS